MKTLATESDSGMTMCEPWRRAACSWGEVFNLTVSKSFLDCNTVVVI